MFSKLFIKTVAATVMMASAASAVFNNTVYIVSNAETPSLGLPGLTLVGQDRATNCIPAVFAPLNIGFIVTCPFDVDSGLCSETEATAVPVAAALGLTPNTSCGAGESTEDDCVSDLMKSFGKNSTQSILLIWDLSGMDSLFEVLNVDDDFGGEEDTDDSTPHFDLITTVVKSKITALTSMGCPGIDGQAPGSFRRRSLSQTAILKKKQNIKKFNSRVTRLLNSPA